MKPQLPDEIRKLFPVELVTLINSYVPHLPKPKKSPGSICSYSPEMEKDLRRIQCHVLKGKNEMFMKELEDFVL